MEEIIRAICIGAHKALAHTGWSFVFVMWKQDAPIRGETVAIAAPPDVRQDQAAEACEFVQKKLRSRIIH
ncbi:MAG: hypothetical protein AAGK93_00555 [Pseudomonadota bacterium]